MVTSRSICALTGKPMRKKNFFKTFIRLSNSDEEEAAKLLLEKGADINGRNKRGLTPLMFAALKGHTSTMKVFIQQPNIDFRAQVSQEKCSFSLACAINWKFS